MSIRLTFSTSFRQDPRCPACGHELLQDAIAFRESVAVCTRCSVSGSSALESAIAFAIEDHAHGSHASEWTVSRGLHFWTPPHYAEHETYICRFTP